jgi:hypothetical protein
MSGPICTPGSRPGPTRSAAIERFMERMYADAGVDGVMRVQGLLRGKV